MLQIWQKILFNTGFLEFCSVFYQKRWEFGGLNVKTECWICWIFDLIICVIGQGQINLDSSFNYGPVLTCLPIRSDQGDRDASITSACCNRAIHFLSKNPSHQTPDLSSQVCLWEGDQEEEVSFWPFGPSPASTDIWFHPTHHRPTY